MTVHGTKASEQSAFDKLKGSVTSAPVLISPDSTKPFCIEADSSNFATGTVLSQVSAEDEKWHPVMFLSPVECNYRYMTRRYLLSSGHSRSGGTLSKVLNTPVRY